MERGGGGGGGGAESRLIFFWTLAHASGSGVQEPTCLKPPDPVWLGSSGGELRSFKPVQPRPARKTQGEACGKESRLGSSSPSPFLLIFFSSLCYIRLWRSTNNRHKSFAAARFALVVLRRRRVLARLCACIYFFSSFFSSLPSRRVCIFFYYFFFEFPALVPLRAAGVALISELIDSSVIGFISYPLLEVVKPRQEWFLKVYF